MIDSFEKYQYYLAEDKKALREYTHGNSAVNPFLIDLVLWDFQKSLRRCEYLYNCDNRGVIWRIKKYFAARQFKKLSIKLGFTIPVNCFGPGLRIAHRGTIIVNGGARIGANCTINASVNIGAKLGDDSKVPLLGNNIFIAPGAKIYGDVYIADNCVIGANAVVNKSEYNMGTTLVGVPAKPLK